VCVRDVDNGLRLDRSLATSTLISPFLPLHGVSSCLVFLYLFVPRADQCCVEGYLVEHVKVQ
jgi:hypothetical protein